MKKFKRVISGVVCAYMLLTNMSLAYANDTTEVQDAWNYSLVSETTKELYTDFPMIINKTLGKDLDMSMQFQYLKNISENDNVTVTITDLSDNRIVECYQLTPNNNYIIWENVENDKQFSVSISELINGIENDFIGYINTKFVSADFPVDIKLGDINYNNNNGEEFEYVAIKKVGLHASCNHEEEQECTSLCTTAGLLDYLDADDLNTFYSSLDGNSYYEMQADISCEGQSNHYRGFVSTYPGGEELGVFTRGYSFSLEPVAPLSVASENSYGIATASVTPDDYDFTTASDYEYYQNVNISSLGLYSDIIVKWVVPENGSYTIETIGNLDTMFYEFSSYSDGVISDTVYTRTNGGTGENARVNWSLAAGVVKYFVLNLESGTAGQCAFRIIRNDYNTNVDGIPAYRDEVQANYEAGEFSPISGDNYRLQYDRDINIYAYDVSSGNGYLSFENIETPLTVRLFTITGQKNGLDSLWQEATYSVPAGDAEYVVQHTFSDEVYYVDVFQATPPSIGSDDYFIDDKYSYDFDFYDPKLKDEEDIAANATYGDSPVNPVEITKPSYINSTRTLHRAETDWFYFETEDDGGDLEAAICQTDNGYQYEIALYDEIEIVSTDPPSWYDSENIGTITEQSGYYLLTYNGLLPNHTYFIEISRPNSSTYSSYYPYQLDVYITTPNPTATLDGNVSLTHTIGNDISSLSDMLNAVMTQMTCTLYGETVADSTAISDVELYYDNNVLTTDIVNSLTAGSYTIVPKYKGVAATGGTVTLTVSEATSQNRVEVSFSTQECGVEEYDCFHCAKILANFRLSSEGSATTTLTEEDAAVYFNYDPEFPERVSLYKTLQATGYFYTNGQSASTAGFSRITNSAQLTEDDLYTRVASNKIVIMQLSNSSAPTDVTQMRYLIVCGVDTSTHQLKIYDCNKPSQKTAWYDTSLFTEGGYVEDNLNIKFNGSIVESVSTTN